MMLIPNTNFAILSVDKDFDPKTTGSAGYTFKGKVEAVGQPEFAPQPVAGDGRNFSFARQPEPFPLKKGDEVICGGYIDYILKDHENNKTLIVVFKDQIYAIVRDEQEEIGLFNQEMAAQEPQFIQG